MLATTVASAAAALGLAVFSQGTSATPIPGNKYSDLERRYPHINYTEPSDNTDLFTYNGDNWYHKYNQSFSNDLDASYEFHTGSGTVEYQIWAGKKNDRGKFTILFDGEQVGEGDAYADSETGTDPVKLFGQKGLDTADHIVTVKNEKDSRVPDEQPYLDLSYVFFRS